MLYRLQIMIPFPLVVLTPWLCRGMGLQMLCHVRNTEVSLTGLSPVLDPIVRRCSSLFGHVARLPEDTPAQQALR